MIPYLFINMAYSVARMSYKAPEPFVTENLRHKLAMAKYQARREIDLRVEQRIFQLKQDALRKERAVDLQRVGQIYKDSFRSAMFAYMAAIVWLFI